jgi:hypothetical protein
MLIEVSHESPISILKSSLEYNDYCYALVHLFETHDTYFNFFKEAKLLGKEVYLDNSIFELGKSFDPDKYSKWIEKLQPNLYIVPDVLEDAPGTMEHWIDWEDKYHPRFPDCRTMGVVQGRTWQELHDCYKLMAECADMIAISFDYSYYNITGEGFTNLEQFASGRQRFISQLIDRGIWEWQKPHHLLGCSLAREFRYYIDNDIYNIKSVDTSNPIIAAMHNLRYNDEFGLTHKPKTLLADMIDHNITKKELENIEYNTKMFKKILRR